MKDARGLALYNLSLKTWDSQSGGPYFAMWVKQIDLTQAYLIEQSPASSLQAGGLAKLMKPLVGRIAGWYQKQVGTELRKYGLRYEDLLDPTMSLVGILQGCAPCIALSIIVIEYTLFANVDCTEACESCRMSRRP